MLTHRFGDNSMRKCCGALLSKSCLSFIDGDDADRVAGIVSSWGGDGARFRAPQHDRRALQWQGPVTCSAEATALHTDRSISESGGFKSKHLGVRRRKTSVCHFEHGSGCPWPAALAVAFTVAGWRLAEPVSVSTRSVGRTEV